MDDITDELSGDASGGGAAVGGTLARRCSWAGRQQRLQVTVVDMPPDHQRNGAWRHRIANGHGSILPHRSPTA